MLTAVDGETITYNAIGNPTSYYNGTSWSFGWKRGCQLATASNGTDIISYSYDAWGNIYTTATNEALAEANPLRYRGYVYDTETEYYYLRSRYYNPEVGRFLNADALVSTGQGFEGNNMFAYCGNNPVRYSDKAGYKYREELPQFNSCEYTDEYGGLRSNFLNRGREAFWENTSEQAVLDADIIAFYRGKMVLKVPGGVLLRLG